MNTLNGRIIKLDLSKVDMGETLLRAAEVQMQDYKANRHRFNAFTYLHFAETNLISAQLQGKDTSRQDERLRRLQGEYAERSC